MSQAIYFIGGGHMAAAMIAAARQTAAFQKAAIYVEEQLPERLNELEETYQILRSTAHDRPAKSIDILVLAVRPQDNLRQILQTVDQRFRAEETLILSIIAGVSLKEIQQELTQQFPIVRTIPNTLTTTHYGYNGIAADSKLSRQRSKEFLETFGKPLYLSEKELDIFTGFYPPNITYHLLESYIDAGVLAGLPRETAQKIAYDNLLGSVELLEQEQVLPRELLNRNNSPGGVGIHLAYELNQQHFTGTIQAAVLAAVKRTTELGGSAND